MARGLARQKIDGKAENRGSETWQLVKTVGGWRIAAINYSSDPAVQQIATGNQIHVRCLIHNLNTI